MRLRLIGGGALLALGITVGALVAPGPAPSSAEETSVAATGRFDPGRLHSELEAGGVTVKTIRTTADGVEVILADAAQEAQARVKIAAHDPDFDPDATDHNAARAAFVTLKNASTWAQAKPALLAILKRLYQRSTGKEIE